MSPAEYLQNTFIDRKDEIFAAVTTPEFYIEMLLTGIAVVAGVLIAAIIRRRINLYLKRHPLKTLDPEFFTKPLSLLGTILTLVCLTVAKPFAIKYGVGGSWLAAFAEVCVAYLAARTALLIIPSRGVAWFIAVVAMIVGVLDATGFMKSTTEYLHSMELTVGKFQISMLNLAHGIIILVVVFWIAGVLSRTLESYLRRSSSLSYNARELTVKFFKLFIYFVALLITLSAIGVDLTAFAVFGGALGVGIGLGLQKVTANFISGITLLMEKAIQIGDLIEVGGVSGWVRQLNVRYTLLETSDGREVLIPNEELLTTRVMNWTHSNNNARIEIKVMVNYDSDPTKVQEFMLAAARAHPLCLKNPAPSCFLREFLDGGMQFALTFWIPDVREGRFEPQSSVMIAIHQRFHEAGIQFTSPQRAVYLAPK